MSRGSACPQCGGYKARRSAKRCRTCRNANMQGRTCSLDGCERPHVANGVCRFHRDRLERGIPLDAPIRGVDGFRRGVDDCPVDGCERKSFSVSSGLCSMHDSRLRKTGELGPAHSLRRPAGAWVPWQTDRYGYVRRREDGKWVTQHRVVMEQIIGRALNPWESVHHKNGIRHDNSPGNLELWVKRQPYGQRVEDLVSWVVDNYPDYVRAALDGRPHLFIVPPATEEGA